MGTTKFLFDVERKLVKVLICHGEKESGLLRLVNVIFCVFDNSTCKKDVHTVLSNALSRLHVVPPREKNTAGILGK